MTGFPGFLALVEHTMRDLEGSGIEVPGFAEYVDRLVEFRVAHGEIGAAAMV